MAVVVKLTRVALLIPVAILIGIIMNWKERSTVTGRKFFLEIHSDTVVHFWVFIDECHLFFRCSSSEPLAEMLVMLSYIFMAMAMAGLGLSIDLVTFKKYGGKPFIAGLVRLYIFDLPRVCIGSGFPFKLTFQFKQASLNRHACFFLLDAEHWHHKNFIHFRLKPFYNFLPFPLYSAFPLYNRISNY